jgi:hypothetical protein
MKTMAKLVTSLVAVFAVALSAAATASADEAGFVSSVESLNHYATECAGCVNDALDVGYKACAAFDRGGPAAAIQAVLQAYNGPGQMNQEYYATLFAQYAAHQLCPQHDGEIGQI